MFNVFSRKKHRFVALFEINAIFVLFDDGGAAQKNNAFQFVSLAIPTSNGFGGKMSQVKPKLLKFVQMDECMVVHLSHAGRISER